MVGSRRRPFLLGACVGRVGAVSALVGSAIRFTASRAFALVSSSRIYLGRAKFS